MHIKSRFYFILHVTKTTFLVQIHITGQNYFALIVFKHTKISGGLNIFSLPLVFDSSMKKILFFVNIRTKRPCKVLFFYKYFPLTYPQGFASKDPDLKKCSCKYFNFWNKPAYFIAYLYKIFKMNILFSDYVISFLNQFDLDMNVSYPDFTFS